MNKVTWWCGGVDPISMTVVGERDGIVAYKQVRLNHAGFYELFAMAVTWIEDTIKRIELEGEK